ncbi:MAG: hypothetical protein HZA91_01580 [Verrucomicrobia bacterium]|nr:hypothetical protein [Verrucomicrobiota bacterium]
MKPRVTCLTLFVVHCLFSCAGRAETNDSPLSISVKAAKSDFEVGERTWHAVVVSNRSAQVVAIPSFGFLNIKQEDPYASFYVRQKILRLEVKCGGKIIPMGSGWSRSSTEAPDFPTVELRPGETAGVGFSLTRRWFPCFYTLTNAGLYTLTVALDTTAVRNDKMVKGVFTSPPTEFRIIPWPTFREQRLDESCDDYAEEKATFYLKRIVSYKGEFYPNVDAILRTQGSVPALIRILASSDKELAGQARSLLGGIHYPSGRPPPHPPRPSSIEQWKEWWQTTGVKMSVKEFWSNFDSHFP